MWNLAYRSAHCGEHRNYQAIEWQLQAYGYPQARQLLYHARVREKLDAICAEAQRSRPRLLILTASLRALTIIRPRPAQLEIFRILRFAHHRSIAFSSARIASRLAPPIEPSSGLGGM